MNNTVEQLTESQKSLMVEALSRYLLQGLAETEEEINECEMLMTLLSSPNEEE